MYTPPPLLSSTLAQVVLQPSTNHRIRQSNHLPTRPIAIPAMPRIAIETLHRVVHKHSEEISRGKLRPCFLRSFALLHPGQQFDLLVLGKNSEFAAIKHPATFLDISDSLTIGLAMVPVRPAKLTVNEVDNSGPSRARSVIRWNDLIASSGQSSCFVHGQKPPRGATSPTRNGRGSSGSRD